MLLPARKECTRMLIVNLRCTDERYLYVIAGSSRDFDHGAAWTVMTYIVGSYSISKSRNAEAADNLIIVRLSVKPQKYLSRGSFLGSSFFLNPFSWVHDYSISLFLLSYVFCGCDPLSRVFLYYVWVIDVFLTPLVPSTTQQSSLQLLCAL
jgi:hypothetical protein